VSEAEIVAYRVVIEGRVQGVWFRAETAQEAARLGVRGWVANRDDGAVEAVVEGPTSAVEEILAWCHHGPPRAVVTQVTARSVTPSGARRFEVRTQP
jgi:acylphosphatase